MEPTPVIVNNGGSTEKKSGMSPWIWVAIAGAVLLFFMSSGGKPYVYKRTQAAEDRLDAALQTGDYAPLLGKDNSPLILKSEDYSRPQSEITAALQNAFAYFEPKMATLAANLALPQSNIGDSIVSAFLAAALDPAAKALTQAKVDLFMQLFEIWCRTYAVIAPPAMTAIASIVEASGDAMNNATTCVRTAYIKDVTENASFSEQHWATSVLSNSSWSGLWGLAKGGKSTNTESSGGSSVSTQSRHVTYIPHCEAYQVDENKAFGIMACQTLALQIPVASLQSVIKNYPDFGAILRL